MNYPNSWNEASAFLLNGTVCGDFNLDHDDENNIEFTSYMAEAKSCWYVIDAEMVAKAKPLDNDGIAIQYHDEIVEIVPLFLAQPQTPGHELTDIHMLVNEGEEHEIAFIKEQNGVIFGVDQSYLEQNIDDVRSPYGNGIVKIRL